jgi:hypothetical protein
VQGAASDHDGGASMQVRGVSWYYWMTGAALWFSLAVWYLSADSQTILNRFTSSHAALPKGHGNMTSGPNTFILS